MTSLAICGTGNHGLAFAGVLGRWCEQMLTGVEVRLPPQNTSDASWVEAIVKSTRGIDAAMVCVFKNDVRSSQLHFQLGVCFRSLGSERPLVPVLVDMEPKDIAQTPLELFQCVTCCERDLRKLLEDLSAVLLPTVSTATTIARFSNSWSKLQLALDKVPGPEVRPFEITLALPEITQSWPYSAGPADGEWSATAGPLIAALPQLGFPEFDASELRYLDLSRQEWIRPPIGSRASRQATSA